MGFQRHQNKVRFEETDHFERVAKGLKVGESTGQHTFSIFEGTSRRIGEGNLINALAVGKRFQIETKMRRSRFRNDANSD